MSPVVTAGRRFGVAAVVAGLLAAFGYLVLVQIALGQEIENLALRGARQELDVVRQE